jgi:segregation and condensation protein A
MIRLKLPNFEGPLDLLLYLIRKNKLDIKTISLAQITHEYLEYILMFQKLDLNLAGEYIVMATTLIKIKVRSLLPVEPFTESEEYDDEASLLVKKLKEYEKIKKIALFLRESENKAIRCFPRGITCQQKINIAGPKVLSNNVINSLFFEIFRRTRTKPVYSLTGEKFDIRKKMDYISQRIVKEGILFFADLTLEKELEELIVTFIAILELVKLHKIKLEQKERFGAIKIYDTSTEMAHN